VVVGTGHGDLVEWWSMGTGCGWNHPEKIRPRGEIRKKTSKEKIKKKERKRKKGHY
jgi:hypothetical protein